MGKTYGRIGVVARKVKRVGVLACKVERIGVCCRLTILGLRGFKEANHSRKAMSRRMGVLATGRIQRLSWPG